MQHKVVTIWLNRQCTSEKKTQGERDMSLRSICRKNSDRILEQEKKNKKLVYHQDSHQLLVQGAQGG
jgi:hypothetical protein